MQKIKSKADRGKLLSLLSEDTITLLSDAGAIVAGGAITSVFTNKDINDIDVYFPSEKSLVQTLANIFGRAEDYETCFFSDISMFSLIYNGRSQRTLMFKDKEQDVQFMTFKYFEDVSDIFDSFDFTCCMGAYSFKEEEFILHNDFLKHCAQRYLKFHSGTDYPLMSLLRVDKYRKRGYEISKSEMLRVVGTCMALDINSWEDAKEHIGGMYGYDLDDVFDEDKEFSIVEVVDQLDNITEADIKLYTPLNRSNVDLWSVVGSFIEVPEEFKKKEYQFNDKLYLYKCVNSDWRSPIASNKITYKEGDILDTDDVGKIYFHRSSNNPYHSSRYWVEALPLKGANIEGNSWCSMEKVAVTGRLFINKCFEYDTSDNVIRNYIESAYLK